MTCSLLGAVLLLWNRFAAANYIRQRPTPHTYWYRRRTSGQAL